jgi:hypothetical protein
MNCDQPAQPGTIREIEEEELSDEADFQDQDSQSGKEQA